MTKPPIDVTWRTTSSAYVAFPPATLDPALAAQLMRVSAEMLAATFALLQHQGASEARTQALAHWRQAQEAVQQAIEWQQRGGGQHA